MALGRTSRMRLAIPLSMVAMVRPAAIASRQMAESAATPRQRCAPRASGPMAAGQGRVPVN